MAERKVTRLRFTKNELTDEKVRRAAAKAERAADRAEKAQSKLPKKDKAAHYPRSRRGCIPRQQAPDEEIVRYGGTKQAPCGACGDICGQAGFVKQTGKNVAHASAVRALNGGAGFCGC